MSGFVVTGEHAAVSAPKVLELRLLRLVIQAVLEAAHPWASLGLPVAVAAADLDVQRGVVDFPDVHLERDGVDAVESAHLIAYTLYGVVEAEEDRLHIIELQCRTIG